MSRPRSTGKLFPNCDLSVKTIRNKERNVASAQLMWPNGDTLAFPERVVKYSVKKGYTLSFTRGTNITSVPSHVDRKSSVVLKGLTLMQSGAD